MKKREKSRLSRITTSPPVNVVICGVGGQGIILASNVLCHAAYLEGCDVKKSEVHGMAQRGGTVITHVRFGKKVYSPLIEEGHAEYLLAFEKLEALRYSHFLKKNGIAIVNERQIPPMSVLVGSATYPSTIEQRLRSKCTPHYIPAEKYASSLGNVKVVNIILLGVLSHFLSLREKSWRTAIEREVKPKYIELNKKAFLKGRTIPEST